MQSILVYLGVRTRRAHDVSARQIAVPTPAKHLVDTLTRLGFRRLGEIEIQIPLRRSPGKEWLFVDAEEWMSSLVRIKPALKTRLY